MVTPLFVVVSRIYSPSTDTVGGRVVVSPAHAVSAEAVGRSTLQNMIRPSLEHATVVAKALKAGSGLVQHYLHADEQLYVASACKGV